MRVEDIRQLLRDGGLVQRYLALDEECQQTHVDFGQCPKLEELHERMDLLYEQMSEAERVLVDSL